MNHMVKWTLAAAFAALVPAGAWAADQLVLGKILLVKDPVPPDPTERKIKLMGKESGSPNTIEGDPTVGGATLRIIANGGTSTDQTFVMDAPGWEARSYGFKYRRTGASAVKGAQILKTPSGRFQIKVGLHAALGPIDVVPPNPGTDATVVLEIAGGDRYCMGFGGAAGGVVVNEPPGNPFRVFKVRNPTAETPCP